MTTAIITKQPLAIVTLIDNDKPDPVFWPNGTSTHGTAVGYAVENWQLVSLQYDTPPNKFYVQASAQLTIEGLDGAVLRVSRQWQPAPLDAARTELLAAIDAAAETKRLAYITPGSGQALVYEEKRREALAFVAAQSPDPAGYPLLNASVGIDGDTISEVADFVLSTAAQWTQIAAGIETVRLTAKKTISEAKTVDAAAAVLNAVKWP